MAEDPIKNIGGFLKVVAKASEGGGEYVRLYRGQAEDHPLLPRLFRPPSTPDKVRTIEDKILSRFKNHSPYLLPSKPTNDWDWLSLGQHFRLPTRLLDWTANPLTALFFALDHDNPPSPVVYVYHASKSQIVTQEEKQNPPFEIEKTRVLKPSAHSLRLAMQAGWHTVHRFHGKGEKARFLPLASMEYHEEKTTSLPVDRDRTKSLRKELDGMGINHATVYGDLQSVCSSIGREFGISG